MKSFGSASNTTRLGVGGKGTAGGGVDDVTMAEALGVVPKGPSGGGVGGKAKGGVAIAITISFDLDSKATRDGDGVGGCELDGGGGK